MTRGPVPTRGRLLLLVALAALTAGCGGLAGDGGAVEPAGTLTPVPVEEVGVDDAPDRPTAVPNGTFPAGIAPDGTVSPDRLYLTHRTALDGRSYTLVFDRREDTEDGDVETTRREIRVDGDRKLVRDSGSWLPGDRTRYLDARSGVLRETTPDGTEYEVLDRTAEDRFLYLEAVLRTYFADRNVAAGLVERDGRRYVRLFVPPGDPPRELTDDPFDPAVVYRYTATAYLTPEGRLVAADVDYGTRRGEVSIRIEVRGVGATTVRRPSWASAVERTGRPNATTTATPGADVTGNGTATATPTADTNATATPDVAATAAPTASPARSIQPVGDGAPVPPASPARGS